LLQPFEKQSNACRVKHTQHLSNTLLIFPLKQPQPPTLQPPTPPRAPTPASAWSRASGWSPSGTPMASARSCWGGAPTRWETSGWWRARTARLGPLRSSGSATSRWGLGLGVGVGVGVCVERQQLLGDCRGLGGLKGGGAFDVRGNALSSRMRYKPPSFSTPNPQPQLQQPGEMIIITPEGKLLSKQCVPGQLNPCIFEYIYLARPDSVSWVGCGWLLCVGLGCLLWVVWLAAGWGRFGALAVVGLRVEGGLGLGRGPPFQNRNSSSSHR